MDDRRRSEERVPKGCALFSCLVPQPRRYPVMKLWRSRETVAVLDFETQQQKLARLSGDVLARYRTELDAELNDPDRLAAVYGSGFAESSTMKQAEVVALMASQMLNVPNSQINVMMPGKQTGIAAVADGIIVDTLESDGSDSFCQHVIGTGREVAVQDSTAHPLVCDTKWARNGQVVSYLGVPIANQKAVIIGVLCVFDNTFREWCAADVSMLTQLSMVLTRTTGA